MLLGATAVAIHMVMSDCPMDNPNEKTCIYVQAMDVRGDEKNAKALCELNAMFLNPNIEQIPDRYMKAVCWTPDQLRKQKSVL